MCECALVGGIAVNIIPLSWSGGSEHIIFRLPSKKRRMESGGGGGGIGFAFLFRLGGMICSFRVLCRAVI